MQSSEVYNLVKQKDINVGFSYLSKSRLLTISFIMAFLLVLSISLSNITVASNTSIINNTILPNASNTQATIIANSTNSQELKDPILYPPGCDHVYDLYWECYVEMKVNGSGTAYISYSSSSGSTTSSSTYKIYAGDLSFSPSYSVKISESPSTGYEFTGWSGTESGSYTGNSSSKSLSGLSSSIEEVANFKLIPETLTMKVSPSGDGTVSASSNSTTTSASYTYNYGTTVKISETPSTGYEFTGWSGSGSGSYSGTNTSTTITMDNNITETANFKLIPETLTMKVSPSGDGTVSASSNSTTTSASYTYNYGTTVKISETPSTGYIFTGWTCSGSGCYSGINSSANIKINNAITEIATYKLLNLTLNVSPSGTGTTTPAIGTYKEKDGSKITISETPAKYYEFVDWTCSGIGCYSGTNSSERITIYNNTIETANFKLIPMVIHNPYVNTTPIDYGQSIKISENLSGGLPNYTYNGIIEYENSSTGKYSNVKTFSITTNNSSINYTYTPSDFRTGIYKANFTVTDSANEIKTSPSVHFTVNPPLSVYVSPHNSKYDVGQEINIKSTVSGGTPPYKYQWYNESSGNSIIISGQTSNSISFSTSKDTKNETLLYKLSLIDAANEIYNATATALVYYPALKNPKITVSPANTVDPYHYDQFTNLTFNSILPNSGVPPYEYKFTIENSKGVNYETYYKETSSNSISYSYNFTLPGNYIVDTTVTDSASTPETVNSLPIDLDIIPTYGGIMGPKPLSCPSGTTDNGTLDISSNYTLNGRDHCYYNITISNGTLFLNNNEVLVVLNNLTIDSKGSISSTGLGAAGATTNGYGNNGDAKHVSAAGGDGGDAVSHNYPTSPYCTLVSPCYNDTGGGGGDGPEMNGDTAYEGISGGGNYSGAGAEGIAHYKGSIKGDTASGGNAGGYITIETNELLNYGSIQSNGDSGNVNSAGHVGPAGSYVTISGGGGAGGFVNLTVYSNNPHDVYLGDIYAEGGNGGGSSKGSCSTGNYYAPGSGGGGGSISVIINNALNINNLHLYHNENGGSAGSGVKGCPSGNNGNVGHFTYLTMPDIVYVPRICKGPAPNGNGKPTLDDGYCYFNQTVDNSTSFTDAGDGSFVNTSTTPSLNPDTSNVIANSIENAGYLITCPLVPNPSNIIEYFMSQNTSNIGGDECLANNNPIIAGVGLSTYVEWTNNTPASVKNISVIIKGDTPTIDNLGYIGEVNYTDLSLPKLYNSSNFIISNGYNSQSFIFDKVPDSPESALYSWNIKFPDLHYAPKNEGKKQLLINLNFTRNGTTYTYDYAENTSLNYIKNSYIPIPGKLNPKPTGSYFKLSGFYWPTAGNSIVSYGNGGYPSCDASLYYGSTTFCLTNYKEVSSKADFYYSNAIKDGFNNNGGVSYSHYLWEYTNNSYTPSRNYYVMLISKTTTDSVGIKITKYYAFETEATQPFSTLNATVLPYFVYNYSMPVTSADTQGEEEYLNLSYDMYGPLTYTTPKRLDPFNLSTGSGFFADYICKNCDGNNINELAMYPSNSITSSNATAFGNPNTNFIASLTPLQRNSSSNNTSAVFNALKIMTNNNILSVGSFTQVGFNNPSFLGESPDDYIYAINYTHTDGFLDFSSKTKTYLDKMRFIPNGYYSMLNLQPDTVADAAEGIDSNSFSTWISLWSNYWNNSLKEQSHNLYITNTTEISNTSQSWFSIDASTGQALFKSIVPIDIQTDEGGDIFILSKYHPNRTIENDWCDDFSSWPTCAPGSTLVLPSKHSMVITAIYADGKNSRSSYIPDSGKDGELFQPNAEMAVSPGGQYIYIANYSNGSIPLISGKTLNYSHYAINTSYNTTIDTENEVLNISSYLAHGGPFNNTKIASAYTNAPLTKDNLSNHHVLGLTDINGILYVLDLWDFHIPGHGSSAILMLQAFYSNNTEVPIDPANFNNMVVSSNNTVAIPPLNGINGKFNYMPYGWPLSANISIGNSSNPKYITYCINGCNYGPNSPNLQDNGYPPIGPSIDAPVTTTITEPNPNGLPYTNTFTSSYAINGQYPSELFPHNFTFSSDFNGTLIMLSHGNNSNKGLSTSLVTFKLSLLNYTESALGAHSYWHCFLNNSNSNGCVEDPNLNYVFGPIEEVPSSFKYAQNEGSPHDLISISDALSSINPSGNYLNASKNSTDKSNVTNTKTASSNGNSKYPSDTSVTTKNPSTTSITSVIQGYVMIPFYVKYNVTQNYTFIKSNPAGGSSNSLPPNSTENFSYYTAADIPAQSNYLNSTIEGGYSYVRYLLNNKYYNGSVYDNNTILPPSLILNLFTNRLFGDVFVNYTKPSSQYTLQSELNSSYAFNYTTERINQVVSNGIEYPGFDLMGVIPKNVTYSDFSNIPFIFENKTSYEGVSLFGVYRTDKYYDTLSLNLENNNNIRGYQRFIYSFKGPFNNTIYMPLDADISNITSFSSFSVEPVLNTTNTNETTLYISGTANYDSGAFGQIGPLPEGSPLYIYYNKDINYYNKSDDDSQDPSHVSNLLNYLTYGNLCTVNPSMSGCKLSKPLDTLQQGNAVAEANIISFHPQFNDSGVCNPEPKSLLKTATYNCNIYGDYGLPDNGMYNGNPEYCEPVFSNGTGTLTTEEGLVNITTVGSNGQFNYNFTTCGTGDADIIVEYYGANGPEPISVKQPSINDSVAFGGRDPQNPKNIQPYYEYNYTYSPVSDSSTVTIGDFTLSFNSINLLYTMILAGIVLLIFTYRRKK